jgi:hypothetical protein
MSQENVEVVRAIYEAINRRDWDAMYRHQHPPHAAVGTSSLVPTL